MLHPDATLTKQMCFSRYRGRWQCASPAGATLGAKPKLFYPKLSCFQKMWFSQNIVPPTAMLHPDAMLSKNIFLEKFNSGGDALAPHGQS